MELTHRQILVEVRIPAKVESLKECMQKFAAVYGSLHFVGSLGRLPTELRVIDDRTGDERSTEEVRFVMAARDVGWIGSAPSSATAEGRFVALWLQHVRGTEAMDLVLAEFSRIEEWGWADDLIEQRRIVAEGAPILVGDF